MNFEALKAPFPPNEVNWRIGQAGKSGDRIWAKVLAYLDNRCIQDRLDEVVGPENWKNEYSKGPEGGVLCGLSIKIDGEWVTKWDGADNTDIEATKGGLSDAMKRAAVQWGIGRYLYELGENWAQIVEQKTPGAIFAKSKDAGNFYWLPPNNVLPKAPLAKTQREPLPVAGKAPSDDAVVADMLKCIDEAANTEALEKIGETIAGVKKKASAHLKEQIETQVKPRYTERAAELKQTAAA